MSLLLTATPARRGVRAFLAGCWSREPLFTGAALLLAALVVPTLIALWLDERTLYGVSVWSKPLKFELSLAVYLLTLAWFAVWLPVGVVDRRWYRAYSALVVFCVAGEMVWIGGAARAGVASHFNVGTPLMAAVYALMGVFAVTLTSATLVYALLIWRDRRSRLDPVARLALVAGLSMTFVLTVAVAGYLSSTGSHHVGGGPSDANGAPLFGWSRGGGDLRVAHFFATHAMHVVPLCGYLAARSLPPATARASVWLSATLYAGVVMLTFATALQGRSVF